MASSSSHAFAACTKIAGGVPIMWPLLCFQSVINDMIIRQFPDYRKINSDFLIN